MSDDLKTYIFELYRAAFRDQLDGYRKAAAAIVDSIRAVRNDQRQELIEIGINMMLEANDNCVEDSEGEAAARAAILKAVNA